MLQRIFICITLASLTMGCTENYCGHSDGWYSAYADRMELATYKEVRCGLAVELRNCKVARIETPEGDTLTWGQIDLQQSLEGEEAIEVYTRDGLVYRIYLVQRD